MSLSFKDVAEILKIIDASACDELILEIGNTRLEVRRSGTAAPVSTTTERARAGRPPSAVAGAPAGEASAPDALGTHVRAPMVGTFYRRPAPDEPPFVEVGDHVKTGDSLCLIEVMKLFTTIDAPMDGVVRSIAVEDGEYVEFDQLLIVITAKE